MGHLVNNDLYREDPIHGTLEDALHDAFNEGCIVEGWNNCWFHLALLLKVVVLLLHIFLMTYGQWNITQSFPKYYKCYISRQMDYKIHIIYFDLSILCCYICLIERENSNERINGFVNSNQHCLQFVSSFIQWHCIAALKAHSCGNFTFHPLMSGGALCELSMVCNEEKPIQREMWIFVNLWSKLQYEWVTRIPGHMRW